MAGWFGQWFGSWTGQWFGPEDSGGNVNVNASVLTLTLSALEATVSTTQEVAVASAAPRMQSGGVIQQDQLEHVDVDVSVEVLELKLVSTVARVESTRAQSVEIKVRPCRLKLNAGRVKVAARKAKSVRALAKTQSLFFAVLSPTVETTCVRKSVQVNVKRAALSLNVLEPEVSTGSNLTDEELITLAALVA